MKCPEAVEWMHRYIDNDLSADESSLLFEHIRQCSECAETFELLNKLSARLEELPKVVPNYSLVDAILPQLDEIDRARREEGSTVEAEVVTMEASDHNALNRRRLRERDAAGASRRSRAYRIGSLGVAAALILGVFIYQYEPRTAPDAEMASKSLDHSQATETYSSLDAPAENKDTTVPKADAGNSSSKDDAAASTLSKKGQTGEVSGGKAPSEHKDSTDYSGSSEMGLPSKANSPATGDAPSVGVPPKSGDSAVKDDRSSDPNNSAAGNAKTDTPVQNFKSSSKSGAGGGGGGGGESKGQDQADRESLNQESSNLDNKMMTFAAPHIQTMWTSPDGAFEAELKEGHLYIYKLQFSDRSLVSDVALAGTWVKGKWSEDSKTFSYETEEDSAPATHTFDVEKADGDNAPTNSAPANQP
ncbi:anti-sigma factor family protein [Paenibacillus puldeungensis]|uniref:Anti-sigma-W factor RsiW n=1 Tax=Paenibacillus puldeungensis TaxID=696536 RepID=A0ABW3RZR0_9BACL